MVHAPSHSANLIPLQIDVTSACTAPTTGEQKDVELVENEVAYENAFGFTVDLKTGLYAYLNLAGFYVDTSWIGNKVGSDFSGIYWGVKNLVAKCGDCGKDPCLSQAVNKLLDVAVDGIGFLGMNTSLNRLSDSEHVSKDSIFSLDNSVLGDDMPTGDPEKACYAKPVGSVSRDQIFADDDDEDVNICQPR